MRNVFEDQTDDELIDEVYETMKSLGNAQREYGELGRGLSIEAADYPYQEKISLALNVVRCLVEMRMSRFLASERKLAFVEYPFEAGAVAIADWVTKALKIEECEQDEELLRQMGIVGSLSLG